MSRKTVTGATRKRTREFRNGVELMRTMFLHRLHQRVGKCNQCAKKGCVVHASGSFLPAKISMTEMMEALNDTAESFGQPRL